MKSIISSFAMVGLVSAHQLVTHFHINGTPNQDCVRLASSVNPILDLNSDTMACNAVKGNGKTKCTVKGGDSIAFEWRADPGIPAAEYPLKDGSIPVGVTDDSHKGPCAVYMKKVDDALTASGPGDGWFKVTEDGLDSSGTFCTDRLRLANAAQPAVVPKNIPAGDYLFRAEILTLNNAGPANMGGAEEPQFYTGCVQVTVEGTSGSPDVERVSIPGYLTKSSPGVIYDIWNSPSGTFKDYTVPGPKPLSGNAGSAPAPSASSSSAPAKTSAPPSTPTTQEPTGDSGDGESAPTPTPSASKPASTAKPAEPTTFSTKATTTKPESETDTPPESAAPSSSPAGGCHGRRHRCRHYNPKAYGNQN